MKTLLLILLIVLTFYSCDKKNIYEPANEPRITNVLNQNTSYFDTLVINGIGFQNESKVLINGIEIPAGNILSQNQTSINIFVNQNINSGLLQVSTDNELSNQVYIEIKNTIFIDETTVTKSAFNMGSNAGFIDESPVNLIQLNGTISVSTTEITNEIWHHVIDSIVFKGFTKNHPIDSISWLAAIRFCNEYSKLYGYEEVYDINGTNVSWIPNKNGWRLPTEAEWEFLCRAGSEKDFGGNGNIQEMGWYDSNSGISKQEVALKSPNDFGLYDMHGNVWEWCWDYYKPDYYQEMEKINPKGPTNGTRRVFRGGAFNSGLNYCRSSNRQMLNFTIRNIGFRIVRDVE